MRGRISTDLGEMERLHEQTGWTPGPDHIRPDARTMLQKEFVVANIEQQWESTSEWVYHHVFGMAARRTNGLRTATRPEAGQTVLVPQSFPYMVPTGTTHLVLWCSSPRKQWSDADINLAIANALEEQGGGDFAWYFNPKPTVIAEEMFHVQVFWRPPIGGDLLLQPQ